MPRISSAASLPWYRQLLSRVLDGLLWKAIGIPLFTGIFFWAYFSILHRTSVQPTIMPLVFMDDWVPFTPMAFPAYASLWFYVSLPPTFQAGLKPLIHYGVWIALLCMFCLGCFWLLPTAVPVPDIDWSLHPEMAFIKGLDASGNACPSLHVASAVFSFFWLRAQFLAIRSPAWLQGVNGVHCVAIVWSTMATRQHVALDVLAGIVVGAGFAWLSMRHARRLI